MNETTATDELIAEYGEWLKRESSVRNVGEWREVTLPFLDRSNDDLCFYVRTTDGVTSFTDDGYTTASPSPNRDASASIVSPCVSAPWSAMTGRSPWRPKEAVRTR